MLSVILFQLFMVVVLLVYIIRRARTEFNKTVDEMDKEPAANGYDRVEKGNGRESDSSNDKDVAYSDLTSVKPLI